MLAAAGVRVAPGDGLPPRGARLDDRARQLDPAALAASAARARGRGPPSRRRSPPACSAPLAIHGVSTGPILTRPTERSSHASGSSSNATPCSQIQRSACSAPQLWPTIPGQPSSVDRRAADRHRAVEDGAGSGLSSFVRGSGARYIHSRGRWRSGSASPRIASSQWRERPCASAARARRRARTRCRRSRSSPGVGRGSGQRLLDGVRRAGLARRTACTRRAPAARCPGRWWTVWRIQTPRGRSGSTARR